MKTIGTLLSSFLDQNMMEQAAEQSKLQTTWGDIVWEAFTGKTGAGTPEEDADFLFDEATTKIRINAAKMMDHSNVRELDGHHLVIETDHPGWLQILRTKQWQLLEVTRKKFPKLLVDRISFRLKASG
jgi:hypothetical protein